MPMTDPSAAPELPTAAVARRRLPSLIWLIPVVAAGVGLWLVAHTWLEQGPSITIRFSSADGIEVGKTKIRYKAVDICDVKAIEISDDRKAAVVSAQVAKSAWDLLSRDSKFFVVRPRISGGTVSGLSTLLSGAYIAIDPGSSAELSVNFIGLENPPEVTSDMQGREFILHGEQLGSLAYGTPVFYRRVNVGHVTKFSLDPDGRGVEVGVFVNAPYDRFVTSDTHFWHASGVDVSLDANGLKVSTESLAAIIEGGIAFQELADLPPPQRAAAAGASFTLYNDRAQALQPPDLHREQFALYFPESLRGLSVGAPVDFRGIVVGEVRSLGVEYEKADSPIRFPVMIDVYPDRLRSRSLNGSSPGAYSQAKSRAIIDRLVAHGMRGQLRTGNLLTGQLYIALDFFPDASKAAIDWSGTPPVLATLPGGLTEIQDAVGRIARKLDRVPIDRLSGELSTALVSLDATLKSSQKLIAQLDSQVAPQATRTLGEAEQALRAANAVLAEDAPVQKDVKDALKQVAQSARALAVLADYLERHPESLIRGKAEDAR
jgi:paraquat-inducible protein B